MLNKILASKLSRKPFPFHAKLSQIMLALKESQLLKKFHPATTPTMDLMPVRDSLLTLLPEESLTLPKLLELLLKMLHQSVPT